MSESAEEKKSSSLPPRTQIASGRFPAANKLRAEHFPRAARQAGRRELSSARCRLHYSLTEMPLPPRNLASASVWKPFRRTRIDKGTPQVPSESRRFRWTRKSFHQRTQFTCDGRAQLGKEKAFKHALKACSPAHRRTAHLQRRRRHAASQPRPKNTIASNP